jgi:hypothetical protein
LVRRLNQLKQIEIICQEQTNIRPIQRLAAWRVFEFAGLFQMIYQRYNARHREWPRRDRLIGRPSSRTFVQSMFEPNSHRTARIYQIVWMLLRACTMRCSSIFFKVSFINPFFSFLISDKTDSGVINHWVVCLSFAKTEMVLDKSKFLVLNVSTACCRKDRWA